MLGLTADEDSVPEVTELSEERGRAGWIRHEGEPLVVVGRPGHGRLAHDQLTRRARCGDRSAAGDGTTPADVEAARRIDRYWVLEPEEGVRDIEIVLNVQVRRRHSGFTGPELHIDGIGGRQGNGPEQAARIRVDAGIEIVYLSREVDEVILTSVQIESDEAKGSLADPFVLADIDAGHEAHVGIEQERLGAAVGIARRPGALHVGDPDEPVEVAD